MCGALSDQIRDAGGPDGDLETQLRILLAGRQALRIAVESADEKRTNRTTLTVDVDTSSAEANVERLCTKINAAVDKMRELAKCSDTANIGIPDKPPSPPPPPAASAESVERECGMGGACEWIVKNDHKHRGKCLRDFADRFFDRVTYEETKRAVERALEANTYQRGTDALRGAKEAVDEWWRSGATGLDYGTGDGETQW